MCVSDDTANLRLARARLDDLPTAPTSLPNISGPSELSNERTQQLYRRLGYKDCGTLLMPEEPLVTLFSKRLA